MPDFDSAAMLASDFATLPDLIRAHARERGTKEALAAIADGKPRLLDFGVTDEQAWDVGLACGGKVQVFVEKVG